MCLWLSEYFIWTLNAVCMGLAGSMPGVVPLVGFLEVSYRCLLGNEMCGMYHVHYEVHCVNPGMFASSSIGRCGQGLCYVQYCLRVG